MNKLISLTIAASIVWASPPAYASFFSGADLAKVCGEREAPVDAKTDFCRGYIAGVVDVVDNCETDVSGYKFSLGPNIKADQLRRIVLKWFYNNPKQLHYNAASLVTVALAEAFPCK